MTTYSDKVFATPTEEQLKQADRAQAAEFQLSANPESKGTEQRLLDTMEKAQVAKEPKAISGNAATR